MWNRKSRAGKRRCKAASVEASFIPLNRQSCLCSSDLTGKFERTVKKLGAMKVSVALCTYNGERYLHQQLASLVAQERAPDELVVCDDNSSDSTLAILKEFAESAPFEVRVTANATNLGSSKNFERAISLCTGDVVFLADQDDVWLPEKIKLMCAKFEVDNEVGLVMSDAEVVNTDLRSSNTTLWRRTGFDETAHAIVRTGDAFAELLKHSATFGLTMAFRSSYKNLILPLPATTAVPNSPLMIHDAWIALLIAAVARVEIVDEVLTLYRQHDQQQTGARGFWTDARRRRTTFQAINKTAFMTAAETYQALRQCLMSDARCRVSPHGWQRFDEMTKHARARGAMPRTRWQRLAIIGRELASGRYARWSNGVMSAVKDMISE